MRLTLMPPRLGRLRWSTLTLSGGRASCKGAAYAGVLNFRGNRVVAGSPSVVRPTFLAHVLIQLTPENSLLQ